MKSVCAGLAMVVAGWGWISAPVCGAGLSKPNILIFYADDLGYGELGCYGNQQVPTPHIDSLAKNGLRFTQGYVSAPLCSPSRAGLMTGRYQTRFGHENNAMAEGRCLPMAETTLANRLAALGYTTGMVGKWHLGNGPEQLPMQRGFAEFYGVTGNPGSYFQPRGLIDSRISPQVRPAPGKDYYTTDAFAERAVDWLGKRDGGPWFLYLAFNAVHTPREASDKYLQRFPRLSAGKEREMAAMISAMDDAVGRVLEKIRALGQEEKTLIWFVSDNGAPGGRDGNGPLNGHKHTCWEGGIRVPFLLQWKGRLPAGQLYEQPVIQLDVLPTCLAAAGGATDPAWKLDGVNLLPFLAGEEKGRPHQTLFWRIDGMWAVRHGDWKLVLPEAGLEPPALYDLAADLGEQRNLASKMPEKVSELRTLWNRWNAEQANPTPDGGKRAKRMEKGKPLKPTQTRAK